VTGTEGPVRLLGDGHPGALARELADGARLGLVDIHRGYEHLDLTSTWYAKTYSAIAPPQLPVVNRFFPATDDRIRAARRG
jgi:hypothetical protein